ncbi:type VI secretion system tube protein TssD [Tenacibaculum maritimum]|uniref:type VI secretion system tube protein TssD n=1 Tax=Tenacibaculum maritimum TaxID=107401 RepID=UPI0012E4B09E|nr:type VI secretion system tube protein TssD [Tenacibaculum maritimum]CAA0205333.1 hypothetical protein CVI1001048_260004 [Tenacibaculum maritimum]
MRIAAKLFIGKEERGLHYTDLDYERMVRATGRPATETLGGFVSVCFTPRGDEDFFLKWMAADRMKHPEIPYPRNLYTLKNVNIVFYKDDSHEEVLFEYKLNDCTCILYKEYFSYIYGMEAYVVFSAAIQHYKGAYPLIKPWRENFTPHSYEAPQPKKVRNPRILNGYWSKNKDSKQLIKKAKLGDTVYFHIETQDIDNGEQLHCKLYDLDVFIFDYFDPDDSKFNQREVDRKLQVQNNKAVISLQLQETWEENLKKDTAYDIELYWRVSYKQQTKHLPINKSTYLEVEFSDRTLYFKPPIAGHNLPELIAPDGSPILITVLTEEIQEKVKDKITSKVKSSLKSGASKLTKAVNSKIHTAVTNVALIKLEKGFLVDNTGKIHTKRRTLYEKKERIFGTETIVKRGKNFTSSKNSTKYINQAQYFATNGKQVEILNALRINPIMSVDAAEETLGHLFGLVNFSMMSLEEITASPLNFPDFLLKGLLAESALISVGLWVEFLNHLALKQHTELEAMVDTILEEKLATAKTNGLEAVRTFLQTYDTDYNLMTISNQTLAKLLAGRFKTFEELLDFEDILKNRNSSNNQVLYRNIENNVREELYIIETIFINE